MGLGVCHLHSMPFTRARVAAYVSCAGEGGASHHHIQDWTRWLLRARGLGGAGSPLQALQLRRQVAPCVHAVCDTVLQQGAEAGVLWKHKEPYLRRQAALCPGPRPPQGATHSD